MTELGSLLAALKARIPHEDFCAAHPNRPSGAFYGCNCDRDARLDAAIVRGIEAVLNETDCGLPVHREAALAALSQEWA